MNDTTSPTYWRIIKENNKIIYISWQHLTFRNASPLLKCTSDSSCCSYSVLKQDLLPLVCCLFSSFIVTCCWQSREAAFTKEIALPNFTQETDYIHLLWKFLARSSYCWLKIMQNKSWQHDDAIFWVSSALCSCPTTFTLFQICLTNDQHASDDYVLHKVVS